MPVKKLPPSRNLRGFVSFISGSGNGHSLISSLIDAHKNAVVCRERHILRRLYTDSLNKSSVTKAVVNASANYTTVKGRFHKGSKTSHIVPGHYNGTATNLEIIGDKFGHGTCRDICRWPDFLTKTGSLTNLQHYLIHVYRNPYDIISHLSQSYHRSTLYTTRVVCKRLSMFRSAYLEVLGNYPLLSIKLEDFVLSPEEYMSEILEFLELKNYGDYLSACASIVKPEIIHQRHDIEWNSESIKLTNETCRAIPYLNTYEGSLS